VIVAGGAEAPICEIGIAGFASLTALTKESDPTCASIPFDQNRSGFVIGEGAGILVLEELEHAKNRQAKILGEIIGYGATCDAYHITAPAPDGSGAAQAIELALAEAQISANQVDYINAHGTSTQANEKGESQAIERVFGVDSPLVSSTKSLTGHLLGAAGGIEAIATLLALEQQFIPGTAGTKNLDPEIKINVLVGNGIPHKMEFALSNSLGFGGHNAVIALKKWSED
jgi:3-oxoacyl-[acyl-carrier-protein] synthase II